MIFDLNLRWKITTEDTNINVVETKLTFDVDIYSFITRIASIVGITCIVPTIKSGDILENPVPDSPFLFTSYIFPADGRGETRYITEKSRVTAFKGTKIIDNQ